jgi:transcription-repair coupling factor (superfamily II helicase)
VSAVTTSPRVEVREFSEPVTTLDAFVAEVARENGAPSHGERRFLHVGGVRGAAAPLIASFAARRARKAVLYVAPDAAAAENAARDLRYLLAEPGVGGADGAASAGAVRLILPSESSPYDNVHPDRRAAMQRLGTLTALAEGRPFRFLVTSAAGLLRRVVPPAPLRGAALTLAREATIDLGEVTQALTRAGYLRNAVVEDPGCVAVRGGLLDVWPGDAPSPVRIELSGDTIVSLKQFDPDTQRTGQSIDQVWLPPVTELLLGPEVKERAVAMLRALCDAANFPSGKTRRLLEDLVDGHSLFGAEGYLPACYPLVTLWDYLPEGCLTLFEQPADVVAALRATLEAAVGATPGRRSRRVFRWNSCTPMKPSSPNASKPRRSSWLIRRS